MSFEDDLYRVFLATNALISEYESFGFDYPEYCLQLIYDSFETQVYAFEDDDMVVEPGLYAGLTYGQISLALMRRAFVEAADKLMEDAYSKYIDGSIEKCDVLPDDEKTDLIRLFEDRSLLFASSVESVENVFAMDLRGSDVGDPVLEFLVTADCFAVEKYCGLKLDAIAAARDAYDAGLQAAADIEIAQASVMRHEPLVRIKRIRAIGTAALVVAVAAPVLRYLILPLFCQV